MRDFAGKIDQNGDGKLSLEERNCVTEVSVMCGELDETLIQKEEYSFAAIISTVNDKDVNAGEHMKEGQKLSLKGIEYFGQLKKLKILGYRYTQGSLLKNKNLTDLFIGDDKQVDTHAPKRNLEKKNGNNLKNECRFRKSRTCVLAADINLIRFH